MSDKKEVFSRNLKVINIGFKDFYDTLKQQGIEVAHVDWRPPAGGDKKILKILDKLNGR